jgi:hypothetical protein
LTQNIVRSFVTLSGAYDVSIEVSTNHNQFKITRAGSHLMYVFSGSQGGLFATFWNNDYSTRRVSRASDVDFSRNFDSNSLASTNFGCRFSGFLRIPYSGLLTFSTQLAVAAEKFKLSIDQLVIIDAVSSGSPRSAIFQALRGRNAIYYIDIEYTSGINQNSQYKLSWSHSSSASFSVITTSFLYLTNSVSGSPFDLFVTPSSVDTTNSIGVGGFFSIITAGTRAIFTITLKDAHNNTVERSNQMYFDISAAEPSRTIPPIHVVRSSCLDYIETLHCPLSKVNVDSAKMIKVSSLNSLTGTIQVEFTLTKSGKYVFRSILFSQGGLASEYYNTMEFKTAVSGITYFSDQMAPSIIRIDPTPSNNWGLSSPSPGSIPFDNFSVRFRGYILGPCSCAVNIVIASDFGVRLFVNGTALIDEVPSFQSQFSVSVDFVLGAFLPIIVEYVHNTGHSSINIAWASRNWSLTEIPSSSFYFEATIGKLSQYMSVLPTNLIWSLSVGSKSMNGLIATAGIPVLFTVRSTDSYGNSAFSFDCTKVFGKWNFPARNVSGLGTISAASETTTQVFFSDQQSLLQGTRLYGKFTNNEHFFIGVLSSACSSSPCSLIRASQIKFSYLAFYYVQNTLLYSAPLSISQLGDFASPFNGLTATYFSPHSSKFSSHDALNPIKVLCQTGSFFDVSSCDQTLDFSNPISNGIIDGTTTFGVRWSGLLLTQNPGTYTLVGITSSASEFFSLKINGSSFCFEVSSGCMATIRIDSTFNTFHDILVEYQKTSSASSTFAFQMKWKGPGIRLSVIPSKYLFPLGSRFLVSAISTLSHENSSQISIGTFEQNGLSSTFYSDISGSIPIASVTFDVLDIR